MAKYPVYLATGHDALKVPFVGKTLAAQLDRRRLGITGSQNPEPRKETRSSKAYAPGYRSGAYAILLTLYKHASPASPLSKSQIIDLGQPLSDTSFVISDARSKFNYTAWNSIKTLIQKELVIKSGHPPRFCLSDEGLVLAQELETSTQVLQDGVGSGSRSNHQGAASQREPLAASSLPNQDFSTTHHTTESVHRTTEFSQLPFLRFDRGSFDIVLILDNREIRNRGDRSFFILELEKCGIKVETRALELGDTLWIAKERLTGMEIILDYLVERKTMADLVASVKDGRFKEQKACTFMKLTSQFRQRKCGIRNVIYLVEDTHIQEAKAFGWEAIQTCLVSIQVREGFFLQRVPSADEGVAYLVSLTRLIEQNFQVSVNILTKKRARTFQRSQRLDAITCLISINPLIYSLTMPFVNSIPNPSPSRLEIFGPDNS